MYGTSSRPVGCATIPLERTDGMDAAVKRGDAERRGHSVIPCYTTHARAQLTHAQFDYLHPSHTRACHRRRAARRMMQFSPVSSTGVVLASNQPVLPWHLA